MALHFCRKKHRSVADPSVIRLFSTSSWTPPSQPPDQTNGEGNDNTRRSDPTSLASFLSGVKANLKKQDPEKTAATNLDAARKHLSGFRRISAADSQSHRQSSFQDIFKKEGFQKTQEVTTTAPGTTAKTNQSISYENIMETLRQLSSNAGTNNLGPGSGRMRLQDNNTGPRVTGGTWDLLPMAGLNENVKGSSGESELRTAFEKNYSTTELGEKLRMLRPEGGGKEGWFSLTELNERLVKLKEMEKAASEGSGLISFSLLRKSLSSISKQDEEKKRKANALRINLLANYDSTQDFMTYPPKEHLVEKYFHPDNMSSAEKMKIELAKVREEFKMSESDCGSSRVQVAQLTTKIKHLSNVLNKKDKHSRKGLQAMVERRKKLLKYLRRTDWDSYCFVLSKLGLRDNPDFKQSSVMGKKKLKSR